VIKTRTRLTSAILAVFFMVISSSAILAVASPQDTYAATNYTCTKAAKLLTFPQWYRGLNVAQDNCELASPEQVGGLSIYIWRIALNIIEIMLQAVAYIVVGMILTAGFKLMTSEGQPDRAVSARNTITMAAIGFAISVAGVAGINVISAIFINNP